MYIDEKYDYSKVQNSKVESWLNYEIEKKLKEKSRVFKYENIDSEKRKWSTLFGKFSKYGNITTGNKVKLFDKSEDVYLSMIKSIDSARERVWLETYIFEECEIGEKFIESFCRASNRGCNVILLLDSFGSYNFPKKWEQTLKRHSVNVIWFNPISNFLKDTVLFRNHRKVLITDEKAFCGSINITNRINSIKTFEEANLYNIRIINQPKFKQFYLSFFFLSKLLIPIKFNKPCFYDVHAEITGPATYDLGEVFLDSLRESKCNIYPKLFPRPKEIKNGTILQVLSSNTRKEHRGIQYVLNLATVNASNCINLTTSYFFPPNFLCRAIQTAINNNVKVSMLLSGKSDIPGDTIATKYLIRRFFHNNARFFFTRNIHCHAKYITIDGIWSSFGSFNWDGFSTKRNLEVSVASFDPEIANQLINMQKKLTHSHQSTEEQTIKKWREQTLFKKMCSKIVYGFVKFINKFWI